MAAYLDLNSIVAPNDNFRQKIRIACFVAAEKIRTEDPTIPKHVERLEWAKSAFSNPESVSTMMVNAVVAQNAAVTTTAILGATDALIQVAVDNAVSVFAI